MNKYWYKNAVIYSLDVETFKDATGDGTGDFKGLKNALPYLSSLGITCLWLLPIFDTPNRDNGYDVKDYYKIDPRLGDLGHFTQLIDAAEEVGIRVLIDLAVNHTSTEHFWFQESRKDKNSEYRDYYIWVDEKPEDPEKNMMAAEGEESISWKYDRTAKAYYFHSFYPHQPDLNIANPQVQEEIFRIMQFWLKIGVSGFRIDAAPHMFKEKGRMDFEGDPHKIFRNFREFVETQKPDAILLAEVDLDPNQYNKYLGNEDQMHMLFNFYVNNFMFLSFAREEAIPVARALQRMPEEITRKEQLATFLRNHDELNLDKLSRTERDEVFKAFAPKENMRIFGRGIRRRLASMLGNDRKKMELAHSLLFTIPGTPVLRYGEEIGMGEDLSMEGRSSVRTVMQWANDRNGGFSTAPTENLIRNVISGGDFGYEKVNVNDQLRDPDSFLTWISKAIDYRKEFAEFGWGRNHVIDTGNPHVLGHYTKSEKGMGVAFHNFSGKEITIKLEVDKELFKDVVDVFGNIRYENFDPEKAEVKLTPYGYRWMHKKHNFL
ncbi:alpha-amylase family protein [Salinimicrobium sediminilitoris]|uniref:alpha-amylase family protein n=1 Tax=Salinimicrobium sediminilitoris TaxID=2876715 RepID=UPI001E3A76CB|nr:alpha-amylase family protein [Salinimicrobium sediminilitoris]MCC8360394.1 alpha-amylase family protein [Salinimicrobium sediminilitoris]